LTDPVYRVLADVIEDDVFPEVDLLLREGRHIDDLDLEHFAFLQDARTVLEGFYDRFGCDLVRSSDGYFFLSPRGDRMGRRSLDPAEMLVGQTLCLLRLDPGMLRTSWRVARVRVLELLEQLVGAERLGQVLNPRRKRRSQAVEEEEIRKDVAGAIRTLARLGFVDVEADDQLRLRVPLLRFAEPVATQPRPENALANLIAVGTADESDDEDDEEKE
jgi:chromosome partition protein MukE